MKEIGKYILIGIGVMLLYWGWIAVFTVFLKGMGWEAAVTAGTGFFLSFEMVVLAGIIISKIKKP